MELKYFFLFLFFGVSFLDLMFVYKELFKRRLYTKPFIIPFLILFYLMSFKEINIFLLFALIFSFLGDLFLLWENSKKFFILGLFSFLFSHIFFFITFFISSSFFNNVLLFIYLFIIPYLIYGLSFYKFLKPEIEKFKIFILIYILSLIIMSFSTIPRFYFVSINKFLFPFIGSILFIISDSLFALRIFKKIIKKNNIFIMLTYILSILLIILGFI